MNLPLVVLAVGALAAGIPFVSDLIAQAALGHAPEKLSEAAEHTHHLVMILSGIVGLSGILLAYVTHAWKRELSEAAANSFRLSVRVLAGKWFVDELYDAAFVRPLRALGVALDFIDLHVVDRAVRLLAAIPVALGRLSREEQTGRLQGHALAMVTGLALIAVFLFFALHPSALVLAK